jgi:hypothetical protein
MGWGFAVLGFSQKTVKQVALTRAKDDPAGRARATDAEAPRGEKSRLKDGCSQDWLPHKDGIGAIATPAERRDGRLPIGRT